MRLAWATDLHLDFIDRPVFEIFVDELVASGADAFLLGGDLATAHDIEGHLQELETRLERPIYFVLGNHDFYLGSISGVRSAMRALSRRSPWLRWLPDAGGVSLTSGTALVGHDGWGDARLGNFAKTPVELNDFVLIDELLSKDRARRIQQLRALGDEAAEHVRATLPEALAGHREALFLTHVPPFREACWHQGQLSNVDWLPYFTCAAMGEALLEVMAAHPDHQLTVLCGHTHSPGEALLAHNLRCITGGADYGHPRLTRLLEVR